MNKTRKEFLQTIWMTITILCVFLVIETLISYLLIKLNIIQFEDIKNILRPLNALISIITIISNRFFKQKELMVNNDIKLIENFMRFFKTAHGRTDSWETAWRSEQIAAIYAVVELGKRHEILRNIAIKWLEDIARRDENIDTRKRIKDCASNALKTFKT